MNVQLYRNKLKIAFDNKNCQELLELLPFSEIDRIIPPSFALEIQTEQISDLNFIDLYFEYLKTQSFVSLMSCFVFYVSNRMAKEEWLIPLTRRILSQLVQKGIQADKDSNSKAARIKAQSELVKLRAILLKYIAAYIGNLLIYHIYTMLSICRWFCSLALVK
jgi:hypothetical protein